MPVRRGQPEKWPEWLVNAPHLVALHEASDPNGWKTGVMIDDDGGFSHLLPLVEALLDAGNELLPHPASTAAFRPSQGGYYCAMTGPLHFDAVRDLPRRAEVQFDETNDSIFCRHCWTIIYGAHYRPRSIHRS